MSRVIVHIDRLVLKDFRHEDQQAIAAAMQREMAQVFSGPQIMRRLRSLGDVPWIKVNSLPVGRSSTPHDLGSAVARGIGQEIEK